jgi:DNA polymerase elongation subunit (family B)
MWDVIIYDYLLKKNIVIPPRKDNIPVKIPGGFVKEPVPNMYFWVASMDLTSLYPHLIMQYNISPDTIVSSKKLKLDLDKLVSKTEVFEIEPDECIAGNGQVFRKDRAGFLSELMAWMFKQRKVYKNKMLEAEKELELLKESGASKEEIFEKQKTISKFNNLQMAKKIGLNSAYGACASQYFRYFNPSIASAITLSGQLSIRWIERKMNEFLNRIMETSGVDYIITCDTDSIYMNMAPVVEKFYKGNPTVEDTANFVSKISQEKISDYILKSYKELASYMMCNENKMFMKLEAICDRTIFQAKKQYVLRVVENEGVHYAKPKIKLKGIQAVKSSTPYSCREKLKEALGVILSGTNSDVWEFIEAFRKEFYSMRPHEVAFPRSVKGLSKYRDPVKLYGKGTPIHVRGSLVYNNYLKKFGLEKKYSQIYEGDKIRFVYLSLPNKLGENIIAFPSSMELPEELGLHDFIDYKKQFEKSFMSPLKLTLDAIRWSQKEITTLEQFFV